MTEQPLNQSAENIQTVALKLSENAVERAFFQRRIAELYGLYNTVSSVIYGKNHMAESLLRILHKDLRRRIKQADPEIFESAITFLEDDSRDFGSGYVKEILWHFINRYDLSAEDVRRLENAAFQYLFRPMSREFKLMCQAMTRIATDDFWKRVEAELDSSNPRVQVNAFCLFEYSKGRSAGEKLRLALQPILLHFKLRDPNRSFSPRITPQQLLDILRAPENWVNGVVLKHESPRKAAIIDFYTALDEDFQRLDYRAMKVDVVLPKLREVLMTGTTDGVTRRCWQYTFFVMRKLNDSRAVPILIEFIDNKIVHKFYGPRISDIEHLALRLLEHLGTPEALRAVESRK